MSTSSQQQQLAEVEDQVQQALNPALLGDTINAVAHTSQQAVVIAFPHQKDPAMERQHDLPSGTVVPPAGFDSSMS